MYKPSAATQQMLDSLTEKNRKGFAIGGGNFYGTNLGTREGFKEIIPGMKYDNLPDSTQNKIIELSKTKPTAEIARDLQNELPKTNRIADVSKSIKNFLKRKNITPVEQMGGSSIPIEERLAKEKIITNFINKNPEITNADAIAKSINASNPDVFMSPNFVKTSFKRLGLEDVLISKHAEIFPQVEKLDKILKKNKALLNSDLKPDAKKNKLLDIYAKETNQSLDEAAANLKSRLAKLGRIYAGEEQRYEKKLYSKIKAPVNYMNSNLHKNIISIADRAGIISNIEMAKLLGLPKKQIDLITGTANMMNAFDFKVAGDHTDIKSLMKNFPNYKKNFTRIEYVKDNLNEYKRGYDRKILSLSRQAKGASPSVQQDLLKKQQVLQNEFANKTGYRLGGFDIKKGRVTINPQTLRLPDLKNPYNNTLQTAMKNFVKTGLPGEKGTTFSQIDQRLISSTPEERIKIFEEIQGTTEAKQSQYLKALQKIPKIGKIATAVVGGTAGAVGVSTLANASETVDLNLVKKETKKETTKENNVNEPAIAAGAALLGRYGKPLLKGALKTVGSLPAAGTFAYMDIKQGMNEGQSFIDAATDPTVGLELLYPELFKNAGPLMARAARLSTPVGTGITVGGTLKNRAKEMMKQAEGITLLDEGEEQRKLIEEYAAKNYKGYNQGGRVNFADGPEDPSKRKLMKIMGGLASIPILGRFIDIGTTAQKAAPVVKETLAGAPDHFISLYNLIKKLGKDAKYTLKDREIVTELDDYVLSENLVTGEKIIQRNKMDDNLKYDSSGYFGTPVQEEVYMSYTPGKGQMDETMKGKTPPNEYIEDTALVRNDKPARGEIADTFDGIPNDVLEDIKKYTYDK